MNDKDELREAVFEAIGETSMCWSETPKGIFDSARAEKVGRELLGKISRHASPAKEEPKDCGFTLATCPYERCSGITIRKEEPLAVLADRKGFNVECDRATYNEWRIILFQYIGGKEISSHIADTYAEAESKARAYLEGLDDVKGEGK